MLDLLDASVFTSPDVTALPQVRYVAGNAQLAANACMGLTVVVAGILAMSHGGLQDRYALKDLLSRLVVGFVAGNLAIPVVSHTVTAANALTAALTAGRYTSADSVRQLRRVVAGVTTDPAMAVVAVVAQLVVLVMLVLLLATWVGRLGVLLVVAGVGPVALACHALPHTDVVARIWWRALLACLAVQALQAVTLHLAVATLLTPEANLPALGLPRDPTGLFNLLIAAFVLSLVVRIPRWVARTFATGAGSRGAGMLGSVIRVVVVQQTLRAAGLRGRSARRAGAASGPRPPGRYLHRHVHEHVPAGAPSTAPVRRPAPSPVGPPGVLAPPRAKRRRQVLSGQTRDAAQPVPGRAGVGGRPGGRVRPARAAGRRRRGATRRARRAAQPVRPARRRPPPRRADPPGAGRYAV